MKTLRALAALLSYPTSELVEALGAGPQDLVGELAAAARLQEGGERRVHLGPVVGDEQQIHRSAQRRDREARQAAVVVPGLWYKIELHIRASTTSSSRDGFMRMWLNNSLTHSYDQLNYAAATATMSTPGFLNQWVWSETWDGSGDMGISNTVPWEHYVDHVYIVGKN